MKFFNKRIFKTLFIFTLITISLFVLSGCEEKKKTYEIALITDIGELMDNGFNQGTYEGIKEFAERNFKTYKYYQPAHGKDATLSDCVAAMLEAIKNGAQILVCPGFNQGAAIEVVAKDRPKTKFIYLDGGIRGKKNIVSIMYREEESGYIAGYALVKDGYRKIGTTLGGGGKNPACNRFGYGFLQGIKEAAKEENANIELKYSYKYGEAFHGSPELEAQMDEWYKDGTEVVFACGGGMIESVAVAAEKTPNGKIVGVDVDQSYVSDRVITSAIKNLKAPVIKLLSEFYSSRWDIFYAGRITYFGADNDATGIIINPKLENFKTQEYKKLMNAIKTVDLIIDDETPEDCNNAEWLLEALKDAPNIKLEFEK